MNVGVDPRRGGTNTIPPRPVFGTVTYYLGQREKTSLIQPATSETAYCFDRSDQGTQKKTNQMKRKKSRSTANVAFDLI